MALLFAFVYFVALMFGTALVRSITGTVHALSVGTMKLQRGDFSHHIIVHSKDQLGDLAQSFNSMSQGIEDLLEQQGVKERMEEDLRVARNIQMSLLPQEYVEVDGLKIAAVCLPANEMGGDYYDNGLKIVMDHMINHRKHDWLVHVEQQQVRNLDELLFWEAHYRSRGYEGIMIRSPVANYKFGDSGFSTGELMKFKRWRDAEAKIVGYKVGNTNVSPPELDDLGYIHRPLLTCNTVSRDTLGAFICELPNGVRFDVGNGMTEEYKAELWAQRDTLIGKWITFKYQGLFSNGKPRFQTFKGLRDTIDFQYEQD